ncbi:type III-A CRISPR-associated protein Cas10/Csm1 [Methylocaldum szegediense]|uniref:CRISPR system single-strand-specific deoxyribonuclease Cas10/Csm1 (subtype III-A) n=1 Tax=Methylocaldum szegediense TaxID=73780 RepID=A0ABN8X3Z0_9GAMM|nr:type III-A CRISPR-associated protein Cas10/Csm1 [Methylocaldum szegediense]CAI8772732.1 CRISPR-associated protein Csm1 [Methylocaldum szegediense]
MNSERLEASARVALAAFLHDLGKFAERARIPEAMQKTDKDSTRRDINVQLYCPHFQNRATHIHAAYTAIAFDLLERHMPALVGRDMTPFASWSEENADDSLINAAARHHRPDSLLQWIIATADRLASGFERDEFDNYNASSDETEYRKNHYTARQWTLLEQIRLDETAPEKLPRWRYPLKPLSPKGIFPVQAADYEKDDNAAAQGEYQKLWDQFKAAMEEIPEAHRNSLPLWLDHFDSLWLAFTHAIPSATVGKVRPDVSLYDHSKTTAALAVALWRYHDDQKHGGGATRRELAAMWDRQRAESEEARKAWDEPKFLLIQGDFFGIQDFIFATGGETQKRAAKLLRGRSFYVSLLNELAALKVLEALDLPSTSQVVNAAGKCLIVAPNTPEIVEKLKVVQTELDDWFLAHTYGQSGAGLAWLPAASRDFRHGAGQDSPFRDLMKRLFEQLDEAKLRRFGLCGDTPAPAVFAGFLNAFDINKGACAIDGRSPACRPLEEGKDVHVSALAYDQIMTGHYLATQDRLLVTRRPIEPLRPGQKLNRLELSIFGYHILFTRSKEATGDFGGEARSGNLARAWDFSLPESADAPLWDGYARRYINAYVPRFDETNAWEAERYEGIENPEDFDPHPEEIKTLNHLARDDRRLDQDGNWIGAEALMTLKGDVDNLGTIFQKGLERPTFAKMAGLSRQMNAFFAVYLPWLCAQGTENGVRRYRNTYTVFAGGDDFFLIGPWHSTLKLAQRMKADFADYVAGNPDIHFSAGLSMTKPGLPIRHLARLAEEALDDAKSSNPDNRKSPPKNAVTCFGHTVSWVHFDSLMEREAGLTRLAKDEALSTGYLYGLLHLTDMAAKVGEKPENALWHAYFAYRTRRQAESRIRGGDDRQETERKRRAWQGLLAEEIARLGIEQHGAAYKIALFTHLYQQRD